MYTVDRTRAENTAGMLGGRDTEGGRHRDTERDTETQRETHREK